MSASALVTPATLPDSSAQRPGPGTALLRVAIVADLLEERWPSMDLTADMLVRHLGGGAFPDIEAVRLRPPLVSDSPGCRDSRSDSRPISEIASSTGSGTIPLAAACPHDDFDVFHVIDHSYAHLVHVLPSRRTVADVS
jgi:hypothetical protein